MLRQLLILIPLLLASLARADAVERLPVQEFSLANGLKVLILERHTVPIVACQMWYRVGSSAELPAKTGLAHFLEHMMFKGTDKYKKGDIDKITQKLGGHNNAVTSYDYTDYYFDFASDRWEEALKIEANRMKNCLFDEKEVNSERQVVIEERQRDRDGPWGKLTDEVDAMAFMVHPYHHPVIGYLEDLQVLPRNAFFEFYQTYYNPNNAVLVIVGDVKASAVMERVKELFGSIPSKPIPPRLPLMEPPSECERRLVFRQNANVGRGVISYRVPPRKSPDSVGLDVLAYALARGKSCRLYQRLVEKEKLCSSVNGDNEARREHGLFQIYLELLPGKDSALVESIVLEECAKLAREPLAAAELDRARNQIQANFIFDQEGYSDLASKVGQWDIMDDHKALDTYCERLNLVTASQVQHLASTTFRTDGRVVGWSLEGTNRPGEDSGGTAPARGAHYKDESRPPRARNGGAAAPATAGTAPGAAPALDVQRFTLPNGLKVFFVPRRGLPVAAVRALVNADQRFDPEDKAGLAQFTGKMLTEGTQRRNHLEITTALEQVGASLDSDEDGISGKCLTRNLPLLVQLAADSLKNPTFPADRIELLRAQTLAEIAAEEDEPTSVGSKQFQELVYAGHPFHHPANGYPKTVKALTREDLVGHHQRFYSPSNATLSIVGDLKREQVEELVRAEFGDWKQFPVKLPELPELKRQTEEVRKGVPMDREQINIYVGHLGIRRNNPDYYALSVLDNILGTSTGFTDRLSRELRDELGLAYTVRANIAAGSGLEPGTFTGYIGCSPKNRAPALDGMLRIIGQIREKPVSAAELADAQDYLTGSFVFKFQTVEQLAGLVLNIERYGLGSDYLARYPQLIRSVTIADIQRVAQKYLDPVHSTIVIVGPVDEKGNLKPAAGK